LIYQEVITTTFNCRAKCCREVTAPLPLSIVVLHFYVMVS
jgi:hypothetical protein